MKIRLLLAITLISHSVICQTLINPGSVSGFWSKLNSPYLVNGNVYIPQDSTLTIEAGAEVIFNNHYKFSIVGRLVAIGSSSDSICFTAADSIIGWWGFRFIQSASSPDTSLLQYCIIKYGRATGGSSADDQNGGGLYINGSTRIVISQSSVTLNYADVYGGGIYCESNFARFDSNYIGNNLSYNFGGGISCRYSSPIFSNNIISNNTAYLLGGGGISLISASPMIINNFICNNKGVRGGGIGCEDGSSPNIYGNIICNNTADSPFSQGRGGGIHCSYSSNPRIINNTIANNLCVETGGGIYCSNGSSPELVNCIVHGNAAVTGGQTSIVDAGSTPSFENCIVDGGVALFETNNNPYTGSYVNNLDTNPLFLASSSGTGINYDGLAADWHFAGASPCLDAGKVNMTAYNLGPIDLLGNTRVQNSVIDIGAIEGASSLNGILVANPTPQFVIYPNPTSNILFIESSDLVKSIGCNVEITDMLGQVIYSSSIFQKTNRIMLPESIIPGFYLISVEDETGNRITVKKVVVK